jgi:hypothetical protein
MRTHSTIITTLALAAMFAMPSAAFAGSPLLSGYGGPGAGEQQIVGAGLVNGGGHGGPRGGSGGGATQGGGGQSGGESQPGGAGSGAQGGRGSGSGASSGGGANAHAHGGAGARSGGRAGNGGSGAAGADASPHGSAGAPARQETLGRLRLVSATSTLGLSGSEVLMVILIAIALIAIAALTWWLNRSRAGAQRSIEVP